jgi:hypothetical protein
MTLPSEAIYVLSDLLDLGGNNPFFFLTSPITYGFPVVVLLHSRTVGPQSGLVEH